jgi:hypothetical protein
MKVYEQAFPKTTLTKQSHLLNYPSYVNSLFNCLSDSEAVLTIVLMTGRNYDAH